MALAASSSGPVAGRMASEDAAGQPDTTGPASADGVPGLKHHLDVLCCTCCDKIAGCLHTACDCFSCLHLSYTATVCPVRPALAGLVHGSPGRARGCAPPRPRRGPAPGTPAHGTRRKCGPSRGRQAPPWCSTSCCAATCGRSSAGRSAAWSRRPATPAPPRSGSAASRPRRPPTARRATWTTCTRRALLCAAPRAIYRVEVALTGNISMTGLFMATMCSDPWPALAGRTGHGMRLLQAAPLLPGHRGCRVLAGTAAVHNCQRRPARRWCWR